MSPKDGGNMEEHNPLSKSRGQKRDTPVGKTIAVVWVYVICSPEKRRSI